MGRVLFPTSNDIGVRTLSGETLGADYAGFRAPAEPAPRGASNLVTLGVAVSTAEFLPARTYWGGTPIIYPRPPILPARPPEQPPASPIQPVGPVIAQPFPLPVAMPPTPAPAAPVSQQQTPTPQVIIPPVSPTGAVLVTSGGGTAAPAAVPAAASAPAVASTGFMDSVAAWLGGSTPIGTWSVPNALLAGAVVLGFAFLEGGGSSPAGRKR